ncbi:MAG: hypothetical protein ABI627_15630 [Polyangiaceae bacterium]
MDTPQGDVPAAPHSGCTGSSIAAPAGVSDAAAWSVIALAGAVIALRRRRAARG